jgi:NAD(P)-dependent dehydrogenase (short-subunit alcohol dehydrogenase family)
MKRLENKVALVTGAASGIGAAIALRFAEEGARVARVDKNDPAETMTSLGDAGEEARTYRVDLTDLAACGDLVRRVATHFGALDILVNCAGVFRGAPLGAISVADWDFHLDIIARAPLFLTQAAVPHMEKAGGGRVINITSIAAPMGFPATIAYAAAKGALESMTRAMMCELAPRGINVNAIAPGNIRTNINADLRTLQGYEEKWRELTPSGVAFPEPDAIAGAAAYLASDDAANVHGEQIMIDGGVRAGLSPASISLENS